MTSTSHESAPEPHPTWPGSHVPLGASWSEEQTNFAVTSPEATGVELCLFDMVDGVGSRPGTG